MILASFHGPTLTVHLKLAPELAGSQWRLQIYRLADLTNEKARPVRDLDVPGPSSLIRGLSPDSYRLDASISWHHAVTEVELDPRDRAEVTLAIERIRLQGVVLKDGEPVPATLKFIEPGPNGTDQVVSTAGDGLYEARVWPSAPYSAIVRSTDTSKSRVDDGEFRLECRS